MNAQNCTCLVTENTKLELNFNRPNLQSTVNYRALNFINRKHTVLRPA